MIAAAAGETSPEDEVNSGGSSFKIPVIVSAVVSFRNGRSPDIISYSTEPSEKMSER